MDRWRNDIKILSERENVVCKVSGFVWTIQNNDWSQNETIDPILDHVLDCFGDERLIFGGDWPVCTLSSLSFSKWVASIGQFAIKQGQRFCDKIFHENANRIYL